VEDTQIVPHLVRFAVGDERLSIHSMSTVAYAIALTTQRPEIIPDQPRPIGIGAPTHDIGLATAAAHRLSRDESVLTESEHTFLVKHPERGLSVLQEMQVADPIVLEIVADHHSAATDLPVHLQIVQLADSFDTLTNRPKRMEPGAYQALYTLRESIERRYDAELLRDLILMLGTLELDDNLTLTPSYPPLDSTKSVLRTASRLVPDALIPHRAGFRSFDSI